MVCLHRSKKRLYESWFVKKNEQMSTMHVACFLYLMKVIKHSGLLFQYSYFFKKLQSGLLSGPETWRSCGLVEQLSGLRLQKTIPSGTGSMVQIYFPTGHWYDIFYSYLKVYATYQHTPYPSGQLWWIFYDNSTSRLFYESLFGLFRDKEFNPIHTLIF